MFKITTSDECIYFGNLHTPEYAILECDKWARETRELTTELGQEIYKENIIEIMKETEINLNKMQKYVKTDFSAKEEDQRQIVMQTSR